MGSIAESQGQTRLPFKALLLDMNSTFMFGEDRFGPTENFHLAYKAAGAGQLDAEEVDRAVRFAYRGLSEAYVDPSRRDNFPSLAEAFIHFAGAPAAEVAALEHAFAAHELGCVSQPFADCLQRLGGSYQLGIVSNIWARKGPWIQHFNEVGISHLWRTMVFSSDTRSIKPSPILFESAMGNLGLDPVDILFVGDSLQADIQPAKTLGMATAWVGPKSEPNPLADWIAPSLLELEEVLM